MLDTLKSIHNRLVDEVESDTYRYLFDQFTISGRLTGLVGPRGVGKTTLLLQFIKHRIASVSDALYFSADHVYLNKIGLFDLVKEIHEIDGTHLFFVDEIHKYKGWNQELKNLYDAFPRITIVFSGSSTLDLTRGSHDLSRRATIYRLPGLSFREFLAFRTHESLPAVTFETLLAEHEAIARRISRTARLKGLFREYIEKGYYPFAMDAAPMFFEKLDAVIQKTIFEDIANFYNLKTGNLHYFKKIIYFLATIPPGKINTHNLARNLGIDDKTVLHYLTILQETGLVRFLMAPARGASLIRKPEKTYLDNPTLCHAVCHALGEPADRGFLRELFFVGMLQNAGEQIRHSRRGGDFTVGSYTFEVGGRRKGKQQLRESGKNAMVVKDDILIGNTGTIPLYLFGLLY